MIEIIVLLATLVVSPVAGFLLRLRFREWGTRSVVMLGALPIPAFVWGVSVPIFLVVSMASEETCGADACGRAMVATAAVAAAAVPVYFFNLLLALLGERMARRWRAPDIAGTFE